MRHYLLKINNPLIIQSFKKTLPIYALSVMTPLSVTTLFALYYRLGAVTDIHYRYSSSTN
ncbi:Uncharacterised protein [Yersinia frederiksenii]|nr:Uncharacterised protein [Yersinia frederiksenii]